MENVYIYVCVCVLVTQSCLILCDHMDCSLSGSSAHGTFQAIILEGVGVAILFSRGSSWLRDWTWVSCIVGRFFTIWAAGKFIYVYTSVYLQTRICPLVFMGLIPGHPWKQKFGNAYIHYIKCHNTVDSPHLQVLNPWIQPTAGLKVGFFR